MDWGAFASAMVPIAGAGVNAWSQGSMNRSTRQFNQEQAAVANDRNIENWKMQSAYNEKMWGVQNQYNEGLWNKQNEYNEQMWNKMNQYNAPVSQMERYKEAGLNPNLIYGQSNMGGFVSTANLDNSSLSTAGVPGAPSASWRGEAPKFDLEKGLLSYLQFRESSARTNNLEELNKVYEQDSILRAAQTAATVAGTAKTHQDVSLGSALFKTSVDAAAANLRKVQIEADISLNRDSREAALNSSNLREAAGRIQNMQGQRENMVLDQEIKKMQIRMQQLGIQPTDNIIFRQLGLLFNNPRFKKYMEVERNKDGSYKIW